MSKKEKNTDTEEITFRRLAFQALPEIWTYQIIAGLLLMIPISFIGNLIEMVTATPEGVFTTANIKDFLLSWRMPVLLVLAAVLAMVYLVSEILGRILLNDDILRGEQQKTARILSDSASSLKRLMNPTGLLLILYILLLAPLCGIGYTVSMSSSFQIPHFIMDVVMASPLLVVLYFAVIVFLIWLGYRFIFVLHAFLLDGMAPADAVRHSAGIVRDK
ncbi:MAG: glycerophosphoryl diester phosphodiesterase membrane domain-containing protein, partial [Eubacteriaceae bacterium]|nr:glycerophosphoryl diester phosphodiesterase membrane domain-containing protein [Eubacteriaceae bacterium]